MSAPSIFENKAFQKTGAPGAGFNLVPQANSFNSVFNVQPLEPNESHEIERLLFNNLQSGRTKEAVEKDVEQLKLITSEIKAIGRQGTILMGERVHRARELLKSYVDGTFTKWLDAAFGTRRTGYNMLAYYELYTALPHDDLRERLKKLPQKTAYILASRDGNLDTKAEIISEYHDRTHDELVVLIQEKLPVVSGDKRAGAVKNSNSRLIAAMREALEKLFVNKHSLTDGDRKGLLEISQQINFLTGELSAEVTTTKESHI